MSFSWSVLIKPNQVRDPVRLHRPSEERNRKLIILELGVLGVNQNIRSDQRFHCVDSLKLTAVVAQSVSCQILPPLFGPRFS